MNVRWSTNTDNTVLTGTWDTITAEGFTFWKDGRRISYTMDGARTTARFGLDGQPHVFEVWALGKIDHATTAYPLPVTPPPPPPSGDPTWDTTAGAMKIPVWQANRTRYAKTQADLTSMIADANCLDGDLIVCDTPFTYNGELSVQTKKRVRVDNSQGLVKIAGTDRAGAAFPAIWLNDNRGFEFIRPIVTGSANAGILIYDGDVSVWDAQVDGTAGTCIQVSPLHRLVTLHGRMRCTLTNPNLALDPHAEKGSGIHGAYFGGGTSAPYGVAGEFAIDGHSINTGALAEVNHALGLKLYLRGDGLNFKAQVQTGGNGFQPWGDDPIGGKFSCEVAYCDIKNAQGRPVDANGAGSGLLSASHLAYGRASSCNLNPYVAGEGGLGAGVLWDPRGGIVYGNVAPSNTAKIAALMSVDVDAERRNDAYASSRRAEAEAIKDQYAFLMRHAGSAV